MQAGRLRHRVTLNRVTVTRDAFGDVQATLTLTPVATVWASVEALSGREYFLAQQEGAEVSTRIRMRQQEGIAVTPETVITWTDPAGTAHVYDVEEVQADATGLRQLTLMCTER